MPASVLSGPLRIWEAFAPPMLRLPDGWLDWCTRDVFVTGHRIETVTVSIDQKERFTGFVGDVWFEAHQGEDIYLCAWPALTDLAAFCGVGHKTTMGMGAVAASNRPWHI